MSTTAAPTATRSVVIPVVAALGLDPKGKDWTRETFDAALDRAFRLSTDLANWCVQRLFVLDDLTSNKTPKVITGYSGYDDAMTCTRCELPWSENPLPAVRRRAKLGCTSCVVEWRCGEPSPCPCAEPQVVVRKEEIDKPSREQCVCEGEPTLRLPNRALWTGGMKSLGLILLAVQRKYIEQRFNVVVRQQSNLLTYRFPQPLPVPSVSWAPRFVKETEVVRQVPVLDTEGKPVRNGRKTVTESVVVKEWAPSNDRNALPCVTITIPGVGQVDLLLKGTGDFQRQLDQYRQFVNGSAKKCEAALYRNHKGKLLLKMVGEFPVEQRIGANNVCFLHTDPNTLLVAEINGRSVTITNGDHLKRAHAIIREANQRHKAFLQRVGEDKKREVRMDRQQRSNLNKKVEDRCHKQRNRIDTAVKQIAAQVARFLERQKVGLVAYDDTVKKFLPDGFAWHALKTRLQQLFVGEMGGEWVDGDGHVSGHSTEERKLWLATVRSTATVVKQAVVHSNRVGSHPAVTTPNRVSPKKSSGSSSRVLRNKPVSVKQ